MRTARPLSPLRESPRLLLRTSADREELWTETVGRLPPVYGERWKPVGDRWLRSFEPSRSKLAAALVKGWDGPLPRPGERWLYLGAASGTTASHVADLVGEGGRVYAVEKSLRPFARLLGVAQRWPNLLPILGDARAPSGYADLIPLADGLFADLAQPDQVPIVRTNSELLLRGPGAALVVALKTASLGRELSPAGHLARSERELERFVDPAPAVRLDPFHRAHYLVGGHLWSASGEPRSAEREPPARRRDRSARFERTIRRPPSRRPE